MTPLNDLNDPDALTGIRHFGRVMMLGAVIGAFCLAVPVAVALVLLGAGWFGVIAGVHVGVFGGMGYGGMIGAVLQGTRFERRERQTRGWATAVPEEPTDSHLGRRVA